MCVCGRIGLPSFSGCVPRCQQDELFLSVYERLLLDHGAGDFPEANTEQHQAMVFEGIIKDRCWKAKGPKTSLKTWLSWLGAAQSFIKKWHTWLLLTCFLGLQRGFLKVGDCPVYGISTDSELKHVVEGLDGEADKQEGEGEGGAQGDGDCCADADRRLASLRKQSENTAHLVSMILGEFMRYRYTRILVCISRPMWAEHNRELTLLKGSREVLQHKLGLVCGSYNKVVREMVDTLFSPGGLSEMLFKRSIDPHLFDRSSSGSRGQPTVEHAPALQAWMIDEDMYAEKAWVYLTALLKYRVASHFQYTHDLPESFAKLLHEDEGIVQAALANFSGIFGALLEAERRAAAGNVEIKKLLKAMVWPFFLAARELLFSLAQFNFQHIPAPVLDSISSHNSGFGQSAVLENAGNKCQDYTRESNNQRMSNCRRFHIPHIKQLLATYDRPEVKIRPEDSTGSRSLPKAVFQSWSDKQPVFQESELGDLKGTADWLTTSALGLNMGPVAATFLQHIGAHGNWSLLSQVWRSKLLVTGLVLEHVHSGGFWLVLYPVQYGVICWPLKVRSAAGETSAAASRGPGASGKILHACSWDTTIWRLWPHKVCSPLRFCSKNYNPNADRAGVCLMLSKEPVSCFEGMALEGFRGVTAELLKEACAVEQIQWDTSKPLLQRIFMMLAAAFPEKTQEELLRLLGKRAPASTTSFLHNNVNLEGCSTLR